MLASATPHCPDHPDRCSPRTDDFADGRPRHRDAGRHPADDPRAGGQAARANSRHLFDELRAQGFVRVRIDGKVLEIDALPALKKTRHTVESWSTA
jgi:excinuclease ABC subunit A